MSFEFSDIKWGKVVVGVILGFILAFVVPILVNEGYGVVLGFQLRGAPPQERIVEFAKSTPVFIVVLVITSAAVAIGAGLARDRGWDGLLDSTKERIAPVLQCGRRHGRYDSPDHQVPD
jgi:hypothetical protein